MLPPLRMGWELRDRFKLVELVSAQLLPTTLCRTRSGDAVFILSSDWVRCQTRVNGPSSQGVCTPTGENCSSERRVGRIVLPRGAGVKENRKAPLVGAFVNWSAPGHGFCGRWVTDFAWLGLKFFVRCGSRILRGRRRLFWLGDAEKCPRYPGAVGFRQHGPRAWDSRPGSSF